MKMRISLTALMFCAGATSPVHARAEKVFLRPEPGGPMGLLTAVAFSPDGDRVYATGFDKVVRVWALNQGEFKPSKITYRVPVGPGSAGTLNALAVSPDGNWLAVGGLAVARKRANLQGVGMIFPSFGARTADQLQDEGAIFVFNVNNERDIKTLTGHAGVIRSLAFLPPRDGKPLLLVSAAEEPADDPAGSPKARVRLWDVAAKTSIAATTIDLKDPHMPPGITAWHSGPGATDVRIALAWTDDTADKNTQDKLRVWNVAQNVIDQRGEGHYNNTAAVGPAGMFLTASFESPNGVVRAWQSDNLALRATIPLPTTDSPTGTFNLPRGLATFPSQPGGPLDRAAVLVRRQGETKLSAAQDVLYLLDLVGNKILGTRPIGPSPTFLRRVAASPTGRHVAVADADGQQVRVFSTADLAANGGGAEPQVLRGVGATFQKVSFRKKGNDRGLFLQDDGVTPLIFDFANRRLTADDPAWQNDSPDRAGWTVEPVAAQKSLAYTVRGPNFPPRTVIIGENCSWTASALLPPRPGGRFGPIFAIGFLDENKQPQLALYDVQSGAQVRQLAGHLAPIKSLAFSSDGRLLASAAADQTVCVWTMTSLDQVLRKAGALPGVAAIQKDQAIVVARAPTDSPLVKGAVIEGVIEADKVRALPEPGDFYTALFMTKPGTDLVLRVRPEGAAARDVKVRVGQGTDERHPLMSLFVTRDAEVARRDWIGWTSMGPYDASSPRAEELLGWHFNPENKNEPVAFARADKYQENFQKRGILAYVVREGNVAEALNKYGDQPPGMGLMIDGVDPTAPRVLDAPLVQTRALALQMDLDRAFPIDRVHAVKWRMDDGPWQPLGEPRHKTWAAKLDGAWGRGRHEVLVRLDVDGGTKSYDKKEVFHFAPAAPTITFSDAWLARTFPKGDRKQVAVTTKSPFHLEAQVRAGTPGEKFHVTVQVDADPPQAVDPTVSLDLPLREDEQHSIKIKAVNVGASKDLEKPEMAEEYLTVMYDRQQSAPQIALAVEPITAGAEPVPVTPGQAITVTSPKVRIVGQVTAHANLTAATLDGKSLDGFAAGKAKQFTVQVPVTLRPGRQTLRFQTRTQKSPVARADLDIVYQPPVARIGAVRPFDEVSTEEREVDIRVALTPPGTAEPYVAELLVNGKVQVQKDMPATAKELTGRVTLAAGVNVIAVRLTNAWGALALRQLNLSFIQPPVIVEFTPPASADQAVLNLTATVRSPEDLPPTSAKVNDKPFSDDRFMAEVLDKEKGLWKITLRDVELQEGENTLTLTVSNRDGESRKSVTARVRYMKPKPPVPVVRFLNLKTDEANEISSPEFLLRYTVESASPLTRVELRGPKGDVVSSVPAGKMRITEKQMVQVRPGQTATFRLVAGNDGGEAETKVRLQLAERPAFVVIDRFESLKTPPGLPYKPRPGENDRDGRAIFDDVPEGRVRLHGHIVWSDPNDKRARGPATVRVYANNFQQIPVESLPARPGEAVSTFTATVLLTRAVDNRIEVDLPGMPAADVQRSACVVRRCAEPVRGRRLHLVMIGVDEPEGDVLRRRAVDAIKAKEVTPGSNRWEARPTFEEVLPYGPLVGYFNRGDVIHLLRRVKGKLEAAAADAQDVPLSEVVLLYYQGREVVGRDGHYLPTAEQESDDELSRTGVSCEEIGRLFRDARGAQVVMLDVERAKQAKAEAVNEDRVFQNDRLGVFHGVWAAGGGRPPNRLLSLLEQSWPQASNLGALAQQVNVLRRSLAPNMGFSLYLPGELALLEFGGKR